MTNSNSRKHRSQLCFDNPDSPLMTALEIDEHYLY